MAAVVDMEGEAGDIAVGETVGDKPAVCDAQAPSRSVAAMAGMWAVALRMIWLSFPKLGSFYRGSSAQGRHLSLTK
jgi:hypothetical protein